MRLIDADEALLRNDKMKNRSDVFRSYAKVVIDGTPTIDAVPVVHGRWVGYHEADIGYDEYGVRCSNCNFEVEDHEVDFIMNYCPNCGADMRERSEGE